MSTRIDAERVAELTEKMEQSLLVKTKKSGEYVAEAAKVLPAGVASSFQDQPPPPRLHRRRAGFAGDRPRR